MNDDETGLLVVILLMLIAIGSLSAVAWNAGKKSMQIQAVEHGCAAYDLQTGKWHWLKGRQ